MNHLRQFNVHTGWIRDLCLCPDESAIATGCEDGNVKLWTAEGEAARTLREAPPGTHGFAAQEVVKTLVANSFRRATGLPQMQRHQHLPHQHSFMPFDFVFVPAAKSIRN